jgi:hypothetical protein
MPSEGRGGELSLPQKRIIDGFDEAAKGLAAGTISRRRALKLTATALLGGGLLAMYPGVAGAQVSVEQTCAGGTALNNRRCRASNCGGNSNCFCALTVSGTKACVNIRNVNCPTVDECDSNPDCARGEVCIKVGGCCSGSRRNACAPRCS